jgi:methyl-accepting chemotaxis protein
MFMPLPAAYQLALETFDLAADTSAARREIWQLLSALMDRIVDEHERRTAQFAPYRGSVAAKDRRNAELITTFTQRLFMQSFDESWVADTKKRAKVEKEMGFDMRARPVIAGLILSNLNNLLSEKRWWSKSRCLALADLASRVLTMDSINASILHYHTEVRNSENKANKLDHAIVSFGESIEGVRRAVASAVKALDSTSQELADLAKNAAEHVDRGATAAQDAAGDVSSMAYATEELNKSIAEIKSHAGLACSRAQEAVSDATVMNDAVQLLSQAVSKIDSVANLIAQIADQTNLLALNATIEAARAGQHGRGFAVVAGEVKTLASQTVEATKHITEQIALIEQTTQKSIGEITATTGKIVQIADASKLVENLVSEQAMASAEIAKGASNAARNAVDAADSLKTVTSVVNSTRDSAGLVFDLSRQLFSDMRTMDEAMDGLQQASRAAGIQRLADLKKDDAA